MLDKKFIIKYQIPPILFTDWRKYFEEYLIDYCTNRSEDEYQKSYLVFCRHVNNSKITPRDMTLFINNVSILNLQWSKIPLHHLVYYTHLIREGQVIDSDNIENDIKESKYDEFLDMGRIYDDIFAIRYNTDIQSARLERVAIDIQDVIVGDSSIDIRSIYDNNKNVFWDAYTYLIINKWTSSDYELLTKSMNLLDEAGLIADMPLDSKKELKSYALRIHNWYPLDVDRAKGMTIIFDLCNSKSSDNISNIYSKINSITEKITLDELKNDKYVHSIFWPKFSKHIQGIVCILNYLDRNYLSDIYNKNPINLSNPS
jgi:hypothetical protein